MKAVRQTPYEALPAADNYHGTHLAGIVGARTGNGVGVAGVAPHVAIMPCKFLDSKGNGYTSDAIRCMAYALQARPCSGATGRAAAGQPGGLLPVGQGQSVAWVQAGGMLAVSLN